MDRSQIQAAVDQYVDTNGFDRMKVKAAMFDMDGVLFDSMKNHA